MIWLVFPNRSSWRLNTRRVCSVVGSSCVKEKSVSYKGVRRRSAVSAAATMTHSVERRNAGLCAVKRGLQARVARSRDAQLQWWTVATHRRLGPVLRRVVRVHGDGVRAAVARRRAVHARKVQRAALDEKALVENRGSVLCPRTSVVE